MKNFFGEFKKFITRGNVLDMSVGIIVGGAFTAIVNGLSNYLLKPVINWILGTIVGNNALDKIYTFLGEPVYASDGTIDLAKSIYIDWGSLINAVLNFFIIALVLFSIVRVINRVKESNERLQAEINKKILSKEDRKILKSRGIKTSDRNAVKAYLAEKQAAQQAEEEKAKLEAEEKAKADRLANPTTEDLLKDIKEILSNQAK